MKKIISILLIITPLITGCYNYRELNDLAIVTAMSIAKENDSYKITVQVVNPRKEQDTSKGNQPAFVTYSKTSDSIQIALREMILESPKRIYAAHMQILIIEKEVAEEGIEPILDFLFRDPEIRDEFPVIISQEKNILEIMTPLDNISSEKLLNSLKTTNKYLGLSSLTTYNDLMSTYLSEKQEIALPSITMTGNIEQGEEEENLEETSSDTKIFISNMAVFKNNKMLGYLTQEESIAYNFIQNNITNTLITSNYDDGFIIHEIISSKTKIEAVPKENKITINIEGTSSISEITTSQNITEYSNIKAIQEKMNKDIETLIKDSINNINKKYNTDIYGFQELFYKTDPKYYKEIKDKWYEEIFNNIKIEVNSNIKILEKGNLTGGIYHE